MPDLDASHVLAFWFEQIEPRAWWVADEDFDATVRQRFGTLLQQAAAGECEAWRSTPTGRLAEIIVLDQFSRNIHRGTPLAFAADGIALALSQVAVAQGTLAQLADPMQRCFLLMPYMHSESRVVHRRAEALFREHAPAENHRYELAHKAIVDRFGRYPHRNDILGRASTPEEIEFLRQPGSRF